MEKKYIMKSWYDALTHKEPEPRLLALTQMVLTLAMEVEALREAQIRESRAQGIEPKNSAYGKAYYDTGLLTHDAAGPSGGVDKLLWRFYPPGGNRPAEDIDLREALMLIRLGYSPDEIREYATRADAFEERT